MAGEVGSGWAGLHHDPTGCQRDRSTAIAGDDEVAIAAQHALLRQLAVGFGVHRLYPGDVTASAFVAAVERIRSAATEALTAGAVVVEVRSGRFLVADQPIEDETTRRLAQACYERRIEHLVVDRPPGRDELGRWYELLSRDPHDIEEAGGMEAMLAAAEVVSIRSAAGAPETSSGEEVRDELLDLADWVGSAPEGPTAEEVAELSLQPGETARSLYERLGLLSDRIVSDGSVRSTFFRRAALLVDELNPEGRAGFGRLVIDNLEAHPFAERFAGHLNDLALASLVVAVARQEGGSPDQLARHVSRVAGRHGTLVRLVEAIDGNLHDEPSAEPTAVPPSGMRERAPQVGTVDPDLVTGIAAQLTVEHRELVEAFPDDAVAGRHLALTALVDVMMAGPLAEQRETILSNVVEHLRAAVRSGDGQAVADLQWALANARAVGDPDVVAAIDRARRGAVNTEVVAEAATALAREGRRLDVEVLEPFGSTAIEPVVTAVGADVADPVARRLVDLARELGRDHPATLHETVAHQRPEVVARLLPVVAGDETSLPLLARLAQRTEDVLLASVVEALVSVPARDAAPIVATAARRAGGAALQHRCLDVLAGQGPAGREQLLALAADRGTPRLPWPKRWAARRLARRARGS